MDTLGLAERRGLLSVLVCDRVKEFISTVQGYDDQQTFRYPQVGLLVPTTLTKLPWGPF